MKSSDVKQLFSDYSLNTYKRVGPVFVKGKGSFLWDSEGKKYLDLFPDGASLSWALSSAGYKNNKRAGRQAYPFAEHLFQEEQALAAREIVKKSFRQKYFLPIPERRRLRVR
jgi:acetylornithine/succinyldiaminopimelate/putrescine aminotransferase